jgi:hypothetical protein
MGTIDEQIAETQFHIDGMRCIILGLEMDQNPCPEMRRTLAYAMSVLRDKRESLVRQRGKHVC